MTESFVHRALNPRVKFQDTPNIENLPRSAVTDANASLQQAFRFILSIEGFDAAYITNVTRPSYTVSTQQFKLLNWTFNYPIDLKWNAVNFTLREIYDREMFNTVAGVMMNKLNHLAFSNPDETSMFNPKDLDKRNLINGLGPVKIRMITPEGEVYEEWELINAMVTDLKFSDMNYGSDDLTDATVTLTYDFARLNRFLTGKPSTGAQPVSDSPANLAAQLEGTSDTF
jgi:hypothetical protein